MVWRVCVQKLPWLFFAAWVSLKWFNRHGIQHSTVVGALAAHSIPASLYAKNNASLLNAQLLTALRKAKVDLVPSHLAEACAAQAVPSFNDLILARMANDRRPVLAALTDKALMRTWASHRNVSTPEQLLVSQTCNADLFADRLEDDDDAKPTVFSSWGPYTQISGTASKTSIPGVTSQRSPSTTKQVASR